MKEVSYVQIDVISRDEHRRHPGRRLRAWNRDHTRSSSCQHSSANSYSYRNSRATYRSANGSASHPRADPHTNRSANRGTNGGAD